MADPVGRVPERDKRVGPTRGQVPTGGLQLDGGAA